MSHKMSLLVLAVGVCSHLLLAAPAFPIADPTPLAPDDLPGMVEVKTSFGNCTGMVIGSKTVMTAAHCAGTQHWVGGNDCLSRADVTFRDDPHTPGFSRQELSGAVSLHPGYNPSWTEAQIEHNLAVILWRHTNGQVSIWFMDGGVRVGDSFPGGQDPSLFWKIQAIGDFDGNLQDDILWRDANGRLAIWFNGEEGFDAPSYNNIPGPGDLSWQVQGVGDVDHDGRADILWRHASGQVGIWLMDGVRFVDDVYPGGQDPGLTWQIKGLLHDAR